MASNDPSFFAHPAGVPISISGLMEFRHNYFPGLNLVTKEQDSVKSTDEIIKLYSPSTISTRKPLPCLIRNQLALVAGNEDPALKLVREKYVWKRRKKQILDTFHRKYKQGKGKCQIKVFSKPKKLNEPTRAPYIVTRLADHLSKNPDKNFKGLYNWYFDNALSTIQSSGQQYLLHAGGEDLNNLCISSIDSDVSSPSIPIVTPKYNIPLEADGQIFDIFQSLTNGRIGVRQKNSLKIFVLGENYDIDSIVQKSYSLGCSKDPFVSADITNDKICTVDTNRLMKLWKVPEKKCTEEAILPVSDTFLSDKFVRVKFSKDCNSLLVMDRRNIYSFDIRTTLETPASQWSCNKYLEICEDMSLLVSSAKDANYFVGTSHSCLLLDTRAGFAQKWTHMLPQTPTVGHATSINIESGDSKEVLILSSQGCDDVVAICNNLSSESSITCSPFSLPTRTDTLQDARAHGVLYQPALQEKFDFSIIGLISCDVSEHPTLFSSISTGDIFLHKFEETSERSTKLSKHELSYLENWENNLIEKFAYRRKPRLVVTHTARMDDVFSKLEEVEIPEWPTKSVNLDKIRKFTRKELESYCDFLAPTLLNDYGVLDDSDWEDEEITLPDSSSKSLSKVESWLHTGKSSVGDEENDLDELSASGAHTSEGDQSQTDVDNVSVLSFELSDD